MSQNNAGLDNLYRFLTDEVPTEEAALQGARDIIAETRESLRAQAAKTLDELRSQVSDFSARLATKLLKG